MTQAPMQLKSRRNCVQLISEGETLTVQKQFRQESAWRRELQVYEQLQGTCLPHANVLKSGEYWIRLTAIPGRDLVSVLETQEQGGRIRWEVWDELVAWVITFHQITGLVMTDVNLRNFLYDEETEILYGVDFEECQPGRMAETAARLAAFIRLYTPDHTPIKKEIGDYVLKAFSVRLGLDLPALQKEVEDQEAFLQSRRKNKRR